jgi:hypothetical protein
MIDTNTLYTTFVQCRNCGSCTLASYAVASHHFTDLDVYDFFLDYCKHFKITASPGQDAEQKYANHFSQEWSSRNCSGYKIIEELHNSSQQSAFVQSRAKFGVEYIHSPIPRLQQIEKKLRDEEVLVSVAFRVSRFEVHSCCVGFNGQGFYMIETRGTEPKTGIATIPNILYIHTSLGQLQDSLLMSPLLQASKKSTGGNYGLR